MIYSLCWEENGFMRDIGVNREQKISETLSILTDGGVLPRDLRCEDVRIFSARKDEYIDANESYEQEEIYNGDILYIR